MTESSNDSSGLPENNVNGFVPYPVNTQPEDLTNAANPYAGYSAYNAEDARSYPSTHESMGYAMTEGTTDFSLGQVFRYGFKATFSSIWVWMILALVYLPIHVILGFLGLMAYIPIIYNLALKQVNGQRITFSSIFKIDSNIYGRAIVAVLLRTLAMMLLWLPALIGVIPTAFISSILTQVSMVLGIVISCVLYLFLMPFSRLYVYAVVDGLGIGDAYSLLRKALKGKYWKVWGTITLVSFVAGVCMVITLAVGALIFLPFVWCATAFVYRSVMGGVRPLV